MRCHHDILFFLMFYVKSVLYGQGFMSSQNSDKVTRVRKGIYFLPSLFTIAGLFSGFYSIVASTKELYSAAAMWLFVAMICDGLDGRVARLTQTQSEFGSQLDSISDMVCFGIAPALMMYCWSLSGLGKIGWLSSFWFAVCAALRLARFNANAENDDKKYFKGLPTPLAAAVIASFVWSFHDFNFNHTFLSGFTAAFMVIVGILMESSLPYRSFKDFDLRGNVPLFTLIMVIVVMCFIILYPPHALLCYSFLYLFSGLIEGMLKYRNFGFLKKKRKG